MFNEILINVAPRETRVAILEDGVLSELRVEREDQRRMVGDVYLARVNAVLPGMQAAFVDLGLEKSGFLHVSDMVAPELDELEEEREEGRSEEAEDGGRAGGSRYPPVDELLKKGQQLLVQISKEPIGGKGPRVTTHISLAGRYLVLMPRTDHLGVSRRIENRAERTRLREVVGEVRPPGMGLIVRTVAEGKETRHFKADIKYLLRLWKRIEREGGRRRAPRCVHRELDLTASLIRDLFREEVDSLVIDSAQVHKQVLSYLQAISPEMTSRVRLHQGDVPLFDAFQVEGEIERTLQRRVNLRRGGFITLDHTEALVAVDVNTGRYRGGRDQEETILRTNLEAAREIARQLRLRDMGGIIVIDFIDMESEANRRRVMEEFRAAMRSDRSRTRILNITELGLVEMTRQRVRPSLVHFMTEPCPHCGGVGQVFSFESMRVKVERWVRRAGAEGGVKAVRLAVHPEHARRFREEEGRLVQQLEKECGLTLEIEADPRLRREELRAYEADSGAEITEGTDR